MLIGRAMCPPLFWNSYGYGLGLAKELDPVSTGLMRIRGIYMIIVMLSEEVVERLHLTQSALSHQFNKREDHLGIHFFIRESRHVRLPAPGCVCSAWRIRPFGCFAMPSATLAGSPAACRTFAYGH